MNPWIALAAAVIGYLLGALSGARLVFRLVAPDKKIGQLEINLPGSERPFRSNTVSSTTVTTQLGARYGFLTTVLDGLKVALPTLAFRLAFPEQDYFLIAAAMGVVGHVWPIYYRLRGGRGHSPIIGGMLVIDPLGLLIAIIVGDIVGVFVFRSFLIASSAYIVLLLPWLWWQHGQPMALVYALVVNLVYWIAVIPELKEYVALARSGQLPPIREALTIMGFDKGLRQLKRRLRRRSNADDNV
jgi:glycerol-3-phosphate acyltransferase PlsY